MALGIPGLDDAVGVKEEPVPDAEAPAHGLGGRPQPQGQRRWGGDLLDPAGGCHERLRVPAVDEGELARVRDLGEESGDEVLLTQVATEPAVDLYGDLDQIVDVGRGRAELAEHHGRRAHGLQALAANVTDQEPDGTV